MKILLDNSVLQRIPRSQAVADVVRRLVQEDHVLCSSAVSVLEAGFSARSRAEHGEIITHLTGGFELLPFSGATGRLAIAMQAALFDSGQGRAVGATDLLSAGCALEHDALLLHYDADFDTLAEVWPEFRHTWVVPRGTID